MTNPLVLPLTQVSLSDIAKVGGKNASSGELLKALGKHGVRVPSGFATTSQAYRDFIRSNALEAPLREQISRFERGEARLAETGAAIRSAILAGKLPAELCEALLSEYAVLGQHLGTKEPLVAVRSSATAEDLPNASFAGQQESFLEVCGEAPLLDACRKCFASLFTDRAIAYRAGLGFDHFSVALSVGVQQMVRSDIGGSGVIFTLDTESGFPKVVVISAAWGLGETVVQGGVDTDRYVVFKPLLEHPDARPVLERQCGGKAVKLVRGDDAGQTRLVATTADEQRSLVLADDEVLKLARWAVAIERHYGRPMDIEWAKDGESGLIYVVQARPETVHSSALPSRFVHYQLETKAKPILTGAAVGSAIGAGPARLVASTADIESFPTGGVLVAVNTDPDWVPAMKRAAAVITDHGGPTSHAAIVSRELGVPAVVGTSSATTTLHSGQPVTVSCAHGEKGEIFDGAVLYTRQDIDLTTLPKTRTSVMVNVAEPSAAFDWWRLPAAGVGLARMEFIIANLLKVHPMAIAHPERISAEARRAIEGLAAGYPSPAEFFIDTLSRGIARLAAPFHPHPAIVRLSDFKTNEYAHLIGGDMFEPTEENPMLGFRGASRYYSDRYREGFALECQALKRARATLGFANVIVMVPFCRTPAEADRVLAEMAANGLRRGEDGLEVYMMCEIPANVILARDFAKRFDGFSIGSNDLTQLILGVDRDSDLLAELFDERNAAVTTAIADAIREAHAAGIKIGICGQAPSDYPDFAAFLVREGIDSISLNPDSFVTTLRSIAQAERDHDIREAKRA